MQSDKFPRCAKEDHDKIVSKIEKEWDPDSSFCVSDRPPDPV